MGIVASSPSSVRATTWQTAIKTAIRSGVDLCRLLKLPENCIAAAAEQNFPVFAPRGFVAKMRVGDPNDPLLRQVLPSGDELADEAGFGADPVGDASARIAPGLLQKYHGRALLITTGACAIHCRYCFRREFPYHADRGTNHWEQAVQHIAADPSLDEVILSGGDPLTMPDDTLASLAAELALIPHLRRLRIHTRLPIVIPERVTDELLAWLRGTRLTPFVVVHANHPRELDEDVTAALIQFSDAGIPVLNQAVLLRGVNDQISTLVELSRKLLDARVLPYYLHQLDRVRGTAHFEVPVDDGRELMDQLRAVLPGYAVPRYVQEIPGSPSKQEFF